MQFQDELAAGVTLVRPALRSPNYVAGTTGWNVGINGDAEFNNVTVRGTVVARNAAGATATLTPDAPSGIADATAPGLQLALASGDVTPAGLTEFDDTFSRGVYLRTSSPLDIVDSQEGIDYAAIRMEGRFHGSDPRIVLAAGSNPDAPNGQIWLNGTQFDANGGIAQYGAPWIDFSPVIGGTGGATTSNKVGYYRLWGDTCEFLAYFVFATAGSGAANLTFTGPAPAPDRSTRQFVNAHLQGTSAGNTGMGCVVSFVGGSGNVWDSIRNNTNAALVGADITASTIIVIKGTYRVAF